jgi:hypothetical protein
MKRAWLSTTLVAGLLLTLLTTSTAQNKDIAGEDTPRPKETESSKALQNLALANELIDYGIANQSPTALLTAAEILHNNEVKDDPKAEIVFKEEGFEKPKGDSQPRTPQTLLDLARKMAKDLNTKDFDSVIENTARKLAEKPRSPAYGGVFVRHGHLHGGGRATYWVHCHGHTHANVYPHFPNAREDLDIYVYNSKGQLIRYDRSLRASAAVHWDGHGDFRIVVHMFSKGHCDYTLRVS